MVISGKYLLPATWQLSTCIVKPLGWRERRPTTTASIGNRGGFGRHGAISYYVTFLTILPV